MASVIWDVGRDIETSYKYLYEVVSNADKYSKEELLKIIENEAHDLKGTYEDLSKEYGWG